MGGSRPPVGESAAIDAMINLLIRPPISISRPVQAAACPGTSCSMKTEKCPPPPNNRLPISDKWSIPPVSGKESIAASSCVGGVLFFWFFLFTRDFGLWNVGQFPRHYADDATLHRQSSLTSRPASLSLSLSLCRRSVADQQISRQHFAFANISPPFCFCLCAPTERNGSLRSTWLSAYIVSVSFWLG